MKSKLLAIQSLFIISLVIGISMFGSGCATSDKDANTPDGLYALAEQDIENDRFVLALEKLRKLKNKFPYSKYSITAQLRIADVFFLQDSFAEAALSYQTFTELHPNHPKTNYAQFRIGESHYKDIPSTIARDLTPAYQAEKAFKIHLKRFSGDEYSKKSKELLADTLEKLAEKELYIGNFYLIRDRPKSARKRFEKLLKLYPETKVAKKDGKKLLTEAIEEEKKELERLQKEEQERAAQEKEESDS